MYPLYTNGLFHTYCYNNMGERFQDYSWIQDFKADFPEKVNQRKSASKSWIGQIIMVSLIYFQFNYNH